VYLCRPWQGADCITKLASNLSQAKCLKILLTPDQSRYGRDDIVLERSYIASSAMAVDLPSLCGASTKRRSITALNDIAFLEKASEVSAVLTGDAGDEGHLARSTIIAPCHNWPLGTICAGEMAYVQA